MITIQLGIMEIKQFTFSEWIVIHDLEFKNSPCCNCNKASDLCPNLDFNLHEDSCNAGDDGSILLYPEYRKIADQDFCKILKLAQERRTYNAS